MTNPKDTKVVSGAFHGEGDTDAGVVTESVVEKDEAAAVQPTTDEDPAVRRVETNGGDEPGP